ncbi:MAG: FG-GAP repeat protein [Actinomycetota bacterium]|nr:FG-GAP repeat protein [Actinomycetota bacterium]
MQVAPTTGAVWTMHATAISTATGNIPVTVAQPIIAGSRVEYRRDGLTEWYVNGPHGLEQGFTVAALPTEAAQFTLALAVTGDVPTQTDSGLMIGDLRYRDLAATDAAGAILPAHLDLADGAIQIVVDATGAQWPVTVDPLVTQSSPAPTTPPGGTVGAFGISTAMATANGTTTIVVGATQEMVDTQQSQGAAYVFTGSGNTYTQQARLLASDGTASAQFGQSVAVTISGGTTTVVVGTYYAGEVYVYTSSGGAYTQQARLFAPDPTNSPVQGDYFGQSVAVTTNGGSTVIAVGAQAHAVGANFSQGSVYLFAGSGASYPLQVELNDANGQQSEGFGGSVALVSNGGTNMLAIGAPGYSVPPIYSEGAVFLFTGSGASYSATHFVPADGQMSTYLGGSGAVAVGVNNGVTTVAAGVSAYTVNGNQGQGAVYLWAGSGTSYTPTKITDPNGAPSDGLGISVAIGYSDSQTLVAAGAPGKYSNTGNPADGVLLFTQNGANYVRSYLPQVGGRGFGAGVSMVTAPNGDPTVISGAFSSFQNVSLTAWSAQASVQATFGDGAQTLASPMNTYSGAPFHLVATVVNGLGTPLPSAGITFTVTPNGATGGLFNATDPASTIFHTTTRDGSGSTPAGQTDTISLFPSSTAGTFTVTATADGSSLFATYALTIFARQPTPTINAVIPPHAVSAARGATPHTVTGQSAGLSPAVIIIDPNVNYEIHVSGSGFVSQALGTTSFFKHGTDAAKQLDTVFNSSTDLSVYVSGPQGDFAGLTSDTTATITVHNPPSSVGAGDGGDSNPVTLVLATRHLATGNPSLTCSGATHILALPGSLLVPAPCQVVDAQGHPVLQTLTGTATGFVGFAGGEVIAAGGGNIITQDGAGVVSAGGGNLISELGGAVISNDGGSLVGNDGASIARPSASGAASPADRAGVTHPSPSPSPAAHALQSGSTVRRTDAAHPATGDYIASTDAHGIIMAPPVLSNGIPGTFTRTLAVDGIANPVTYTITNLNSHDGHPTTITGLSHVAASTSDPVIPLTVTGTGFISGSVISYGGVQLTTTYLSPTQVSATIPAALLSYTGTKDVLIINPDPNGGASLPATFTVTAPETAASVKPTLVSVGQSFTLTVTGSNFANGATVQFNGTPLATTFVSPTTLTAMVPGNLDTAVGTAQVTVVDPFGVGTSALSFTIAVVQAAPPSRPEAPPVQPLPGVKPLPGGRTAPPGAGTGPPPNPIPPSR